MERRRGGAPDTRAAWEEHAAAWIRWAREPRHDSYWRFHRDDFLELVPPPGRRTLDLGCGEGRLSRDLRAMGHHVVGIDASPTMVRAAREADPDHEVLLGDAAELPFAAGEFDLVVAFMSLQDVDDHVGAIAEAARVLQPGGHLCLAIVHPLNSAGEFDGQSRDSPFTVRSSYLEPSSYADSVERDGLELTFVSRHRPLESYTEPIVEHGLLIERLRESTVPPEVATTERSQRWLRIPLFLHLRAVKPT
ncbi:MAG TPA: class I SAM-dependent methyltransferase [Gaiellaceae bacterium]|nr:class I SAM-dependent methyltransferase [Gaiellaceae bacterium]